jgi:asparagine synthase (glutamine-hydrolysing)
MCAIAGIVFAAADRVPEAAVLDAMRDAMAHRGPDDRGTWIAPGIGLASRRLSIVDLSERGRMPMATEDGRHVIVHNGEVYNYRELRRDLELRGHRFRSDTDTEVLLRLYAESGPAMLDRLNGMFAFAIWDAGERSLFIARDRLGVKPLYYVESAGGIAFASEPKALFGTGHPARFDESTWTELLCFRYVAGTKTPFHGIRRLLPGHAMLWKDGRAVVRRWWHLGERSRALRGTLPADPTAWFLETFQSAVAYRRISDVPLGVLLSGGLDSSSVARVLADQAGPGVSSFTVRFPGHPLDEGDRARRAAEEFGLDHHELVVEPVAIPGELARGARLNDLPLTHGSDLHLRAIARYAKQRVTVLLSGEGADETMGGYLRYRPLRLATLLGGMAPLLARPALLSTLGARAGKLARMLREDPRDGLLLFNACDVLPADLAGMGMRVETQFEYRREVLQEARSVYPGDPLRQAMYLDQHTFLGSILDISDRMTMGESIECRVPFLDYRLVEGLAALPTSALAGLSGGKRPLRRALGARLRPILRGYRKRGFTAPWAHYFRTVPELREALQALPTRDPVRDGPIPAPAVQGMIRSFLGGDDGTEALLRELFLIRAWYEACVSGATRAGSRDESIGVRDRSVALETGSGRGLAPKP